MRTLASDVDVARAGGLLRLAAVCAVAAAALLWSIPITFGSPDRIVRISWHEISAPERLALEDQFRLTKPIQFSDLVWGYVAADTSRGTLREIVQHPAVADTDGIDVRAFTIVRSPPLSPRRGGLITAAPAWMPRVVRLLAYLSIAAAILLLFHAGLVSGVIPERSPLRLAYRAVVSDPLGTLKTLPALAHDSILRAIPYASAEAAGLFRIVFGAAVLAFVVTNPVDPSVLQSHEVTGAQGPYGAFVRWLSARPNITQQLAAWLVSSGVLFVAGVLTRISFACFAAGFVIWTSIFTLTTSTHAVATLGVTLVALLAARWGDAWSIDAWVLRRWRGTEPRDRGPGYGYAIWVPRLIIGLAFLAAAWSKFRGGPDWVLNGTVKYYFVSDLEHAFASWGPALTQYHWIAVLMSAVAVVTETLLITAVFARSIVYRLLLALASLSLLAGFALFQGVLWWGWWILLLAFLPWERMRHTTTPAVTESKTTATRRRRSALETRPAARSAEHRLSVAQWTIIAAVVVQQVVVSGFQIEARPLFSAYDMYSATYASPDEFEEATNLVYRVIVRENGQSRELPDCRVDDRSAALMPAAAAGAAAAQQQIRSVLGRCAAAASAATAITLEGDREVYDWEQGRFEWRRGLDVIGPVPADWLRE